MLMTFQPIAKIIDTDKKYYRNNKHEQDCEQGFDDVCHAANVAARYACVA
jgi:hypothetical protein